MYKLYAQIALVVSLLGGMGFSIYNWHYKPLKVLTKENTTLKTDLIAQTNLLGVCEVKLHKVNLDGFIEGIGEHNETIVIDFDNLIY